MPSNKRKKTSSSSPKDRSLSPSSTSKAKRKQKKTEPSSPKDRSPSPSSTSTKDKQKKTEPSSPKDRSPSPSSTSTKDKQKMASSNTKGKQKEPKLPELKLLRQGRNDLCAYYAYYHFKKGGIKKESFIDAACKTYKQKLGVNQKDAQEIVETGNDPSVFASFGLEEKTSSKDAIKAGRLIVAQMIPGRGHFYALLKFDGIWWKYDSLEKQPIQIGDEKAVLKFIEDLKKRNQFNFWA